MNRNYPHFAIPEIYGESLSYYEVLKKLVKAMNIVIYNYDTIPDQIAEAVANLDASQLFSAVLTQLINSIATDNTKSANAVRVYKKHDLLYATFNDTVNLYESLIDFTTGAETELIIGTNIREVNISELFIELRELIDNEAQAREQADQILQQAINTEKSAREQADKNLQQAINAEKLSREQAINDEKLAREQGDNTKVNKTDVLTLEQIKTTEDLTGKVASAGALKGLITKGSFTANLSPGVNAIKIAGTPSTAYVSGNLPTSNLCILNTDTISKDNNIEITHHFDTYGASLYVYTNASTSQIVTFVWAQINL